MKRDGYDALSEAPGAILKPRAKRDRSEGREQFNSTLRSYATLKAKKPLASGVGRPEDVDGPQCEAARMVACCICGAPPPSDPHHYPKVSHGGLDSDATPLCRQHHDEAEAIPGSRFWRKYKVVPREVQESLRAWMAAGYPQGGRPWGR